MTASEPQPAAPPPKLRWCHVTPDRLILGLLAAEGFLLLSERFHWFAFNAHKGWTVLIAVAMVGLTLLSMLLWFLAALLFRWRFQYSLRSLLVLVVVVAIPSSWLAVRIEQAKPKRETLKVLAAIANLGGAVGYESLHPPGPAWARSLLIRTDAGPALLSLLEDECVVVYVELRGTAVTDAGLERLKGLPELRMLGLDGTKVTDAGLEHLKSLTWLQTLNLANTQVTDAGLERLNGMTRLRSLTLRQTHVTDAGVEKLQQALPYCMIERASGWSKPVRWAN